MASLNPGVLSKLLQNLDNPTAKVAGDHRSPLLQVIAIVPQDDVFDSDRRNKGFYLRVSDSVHSAYVSVPEADIDLIWSDKIQLGQFVHITRLNPGSPVPIVCGIKPVAKRRPCVGDPKDLISSDLLLINRNNKGELLKKKKKDCNTNSRRLSLSNGKIHDVPETRRLSLDYSSRKPWDRCPELVVNQRRSGSETNGGSGTKLIELCSTPVRSVKKSSSVKDLVLKAPNLNLAPLKNKNVIVSEKLISLTPVLKHRRSGLETNGWSVAKLTEPLSPLCSTSGRSVWKPSSVKDLVLKPPNLNLAPLKNKNVIVSEKLISKPIKKDFKTSVESISLPIDLSKVPINATTFLDPKILWDFVSPTIRKLGKEAICHRNLGYLSAVNALKETSAMENILQCMSRFAEICELAEASRNPLVEQFLNFYHKLQTSAAVVNTLIDSKSSVDQTKSQPSNSALWVQAALATDLANFSLYTTNEDRKIQDNEENYRIVLENGSNKIPRTQEQVASGVTRPGPATKNKNPERVKWSTGSGLKETAKLAEELLLISRQWFLNYLQESLNKGFWLTKADDSVVALGLLGQLKRVNRWLDDLVSGDEIVESLRKKIYGFLLDHVQKVVR